LRHPVDAAAVAYTKLHGQIQL